MENKEMACTSRTHRVGTVTLGIALVLFGILFLVHMFVPAVDYRLIFHLWPCIFIILGIEILISNQTAKKDFVYDKGAVALIIILALFAMMMGAVDFGMEQIQLYESVCW